MRLNPFTKKKPLVSVLRFDGVIQGGARMRSHTINDASTAQLIERAFKRGKPRAVALAVNSPGGAPAQASLIGTRIRSMAKETSVPVYAFVEDLAASGGYWIAAAADKIYVDSCSIVGSIGVVSSSFGMHKLLERHGIERRLHTSGDEKSFLDPFLPEKPEDVARLRQIQSQLHDTFINHVKSRRGDRLVGDDLFTGNFWLGDKAVQLGLADGVGHLKPTVEALIGEQVRFKHYVRKSRFPLDFGSQLASGFISDFEERVARARFGG